MSETVFYVKENITNSEKDPNKPINPFTKLTNCKNFKLKLVHKTCIQAGTYLYRKPPTSYANIGF